VDPSHHATVSQFDQLIKTSVSCASRSSVTPIASPTWSRPPIPGTSAPPCAASGAPSVPPRPAKAWLQAAGITEGPLFRPVTKGGRLGTERLSDQSVCSIVKAYAERIGLKAADFGAHSLRTGFLTSAARRGASVFKMRDVSRHKSMDVLRANVRHADLFRDHAGAGLL
jgi:hypothetical protein